MLEPLYDRVIVEPEEAPEETESGLIIPEANRERPQTGIVIAVGEGRFIEMTGDFVEMFVEPGDRVLYGRYAGIETVHNGEPVLFLRESDILAIDNTALDADNDI